MAIIVSFRNNQRNLPVRTARRGDKRFNLHDHRAHSGLPGNYIPNVVPLSYCSLMQYAISCKRLQVAIRRLPKLQTARQRPLEIYGGGEGLSSTPMGRILLSLDTAGCANALTQDTFLFDTLGNNCGAALL